LDEATWHLASDSDFVWKDNTFYNTDFSKGVTEKEFTSFIGKAIGTLRQVSPDEKIAGAGLSNTIALIIDLLSAGINTTNALLLVNIGFVNNIDFSWQMIKNKHAIDATSRKFNIRDQDSWRFATEGNLIWEGVPFHISPDKKFSETLFVKIVNLIYYASLADLYQWPDLRNIIISSLLDGLKQDKNILDIVNQITSQLKKTNTSGNTGKRYFDIFYFDTWQQASDSRHLIWNEKPVLKADKNYLTEKEAVDSFEKIFSFLERNGDMISVDKKISIIKNILNRMHRVEIDPDYYIKQQEELEKELDKKIPDGLFNPRDPDTYQFAKNKPLVIDGIPIYHDYDDEKMDIIQKYVSEKEFVNNMTSPSYMKIQKWDEAINIARTEFRQKSIDDPNDRTQGYVERISAIYQELLNKPWEINQKYIEEKINALILISSPTPEVVKSLGGHGFTQAQIEVLGSLPDEDLAAIGKTMSSGLRGGKLEQALFNAHGNLNRDWYYLAKLHDQNVAMEKEAMYDFYLGYDLETEKELNELLDKSKYLKNHNKLKQKIHKNFKEGFIDNYFTELYDSLEIKEEIIKLINENEYVEHHPVFKGDLLKKFEEFILEDREEQSKSIDIKNFAIHEDIKQLLWFADGPQKNLTNEQMAHDKNAISLEIQFEPDNPHIAVCKTLNLTIDEPSLIYTKKAIIQPQDGVNVPVPYYFPSYKDFSSVQRWMYLKFLANPYNAIFDIGYVFVLYYGLERHLLQGDFDNAFKVIIKLRDVHTNKSFQKYSGNAVILSSLLKNKGEYAIEFIKSLDADYKFCFSDNLLLLCYYSFNIPLIPKDLMRMAKTFEFTKTNYIKKHPDVFEKCLLDTLKEKTGFENIDIKKYITDSELGNLSYEDTPVYVNSSIIGNTIPVPMIAGDSVLKNEMNILLESAHESVKVKLAEMRKAAEKTETFGKSSSRRLNKIDHDKTEKIKSVSSVLGYNESGLQTEAMDKELQKTEGMSPRRKEIEAARLTYEQVNTKWDKEYPKIKKRTDNLEWQQDMREFYIRNCAALGIEPSENWMWGKRSD
jgi:hypothetical protein